METTQNELLIDTEILKKGSKVLRAINHPLREKMLQLIHENERMIVTEVYVKLRIEQSVASQHLAILRKEKLVRTEKAGKHIFYSINYQKLKEVQDLAIQLIKQ